MPKPSKSSASSATRKKHAKKASGPSTEPSFTPQSNKSKPSKKEIKKGLAPPPKKSYVPPSKLKRPPAEIDPLDSLASLLPSELVVILRRLAKKDGVTKSRALEELEAWIRSTKEEQNDSVVDAGTFQVLIVMLPIWLHRYPALCVHPSRRIRYLAASLHTLLLDIPEVRAEVFNFLRDIGSASQVSHILGSWCLSAWDTDRGVASRGLKSWNDATEIRQQESGVDPSSSHSQVSRFVLDDFTLSRSVLPFIITTTLDPSSTFLALNPSSSAGSADSATSSHSGTPGRSGLTPSGTPPGSIIRKGLRGEELKPSTSRLDEEPESTEDRNARLRVAAMGTLKWVFEKWTPTAVLVAPLRELLSSPLFWTVLHHAAHPPFHPTSHLLSETEVAEDIRVSSPDMTQGFGFGQTIVRRAGWNVVHALLGGGGASKSSDERLRAWIVETESDLSNHTSSVMGVISSAVLRSAFVEPDSVVRSAMWEPLLIFLTRISNAWSINADYEISAYSKARHDDVESDSTSETSTDNIDPTLASAPLHADHAISSSTAYAEFLAFLSLGCNGSPRNGYPTLIVILSTIPGKFLAPALPSLSEFFDALWSAIDGQALNTLSSERASNNEAFLSAWGECLVWTTRKLVKGTDGSQAVTIDTSQRNHLTDSPPSRTQLPQEVLRALLNLQFGKLLGELGNGLRVQVDIASRKVSMVYELMESLAPDILDDAWMHISNYAKTVIFGSDGETRREYTLSFLVTLYGDLSSDPSKRALEKLISGIAKDALGKCQDQAQNTESNEKLLAKDWRTLEMILEQLGYVLSRDEDDFIQLLDNFLTTEMSSLISQPTLILSYLKYRALPARRLSMWHLFLSTLGPSSLDLDKKISIFNVLLAATHRPHLVTWARPLGKELQELTEQVLAEAFNGNSLASSLIINLLKMPDPFIDASSAKDLVSIIVTTINSDISSLIRTSLTSLQVLRSSLHLLLALLQDVPSHHHTESLLVDILPCLFVLAFVMPHSSPNGEETEVTGLAEQLWKHWKDHSDSEARRTVNREVKRLLSDMLPSTDVRPRPVAILDALSNADMDIQPLVDIIPASSELDAMLQSTSADPIDASLAIIEPLAPSLITNTSARKSRWNRDFDNSGFSPYARIVTALLHVLTSDRYIARENMWTLQHALTLALFASEILQVPGADSPVFRGHQVPQFELKDITRLTQQIAAFLLATAGEGTWHKDVVDALLGKTQPSNLDSMGNFVRLVFEQSKLRNIIRDSLVLHTVLQHVLGNATKEDADRWIELARSVEESALQTSLAISLAVTEFAPEPLKLDRYRNELASKLSGIPAGKANTTGLRLLRCLSAVAPNLESDVIFLPQQRAVYVVQALQAWMGSDEDLDERVECEVTLVLLNLVPILQNIQGAHWDFIMDLIESNIENSSFKDANTLVILSRTLRLLAIVRELTFSNKYLKELWGQHSKAILVLIRDLLAAKIDQTSPSVPRAICREQALSVVQELPGSLMDENTLSTMCHLLTDPSPENKKIAYRILQQAAVTRTEHLIIEAGVDSENMVTIDLPHELIILLQSSVNFDQTESGGQDPLAYLLCWMITFDLFADASLKVKTAYVDHLRTLDLVGGYFLPNVLEILGVGNSGISFKLDPWVVDEYWLPFYDIDAPPSLQLLAAHVYYRALLTVPSLVRTWWEDLKDRQLSAAIVAFTSSYISPVLIASELVHVKPSSRVPATEGDEALNDETFSVKVALAINEVSAAFTVDDQQMEIAIKLPTGYPLKTVDVRLIRKAGVPEKVWRKWLFVVQQIVTSHNGRIVDGLALFKKTVSLHFEGQVECPICYSILHVTDRSLPTKPCKTCKNRFHAGCLYKWFNTSHSSSCPLCRSDIM